MEFGILGPLTVSGTDGPIAVGGTKRRGLLAFLLVNRGRPFTAARIAEELWGDDAERGTATVQTYVSQLRKLLDDDRGVRLQTSPAGYELLIDGRALDAARFEEAIRSTSPPIDPRRRAEELDSALVLWRGSPLEEFGWPWAQVERTRLEGLRMGAVCDRIDALLDLGEHAAVLPELAQLTAERPLDERLWGQRMVAAYRSGRQAEALHAFQDIRRTLAEELGVSPGPALVELERRVLQQDPALSDRPPPPTGRRRTDPERLPSGVVTFLLTDIVGSTQLWEDHPGEMDIALARHDEIVVEVTARHHGTLLKARGEGDSTFTVFERATDGVNAAIALTEALEVEPWPPAVRLCVRAALHTGEAVERGGDYFGPSVNRAARLRGLAGTRQVLVSEATAQVVRQHLPDHLQLVDLGPKTLAGTRQPQRVHSLEARAAEGPTGEVVATTAATAASASAGSGQPGVPAFLSVGEDHVGRAIELDRLRHEWHEARAGSRRVVLISGEPGVGKTSLAAVAARSFHDDGALVLAGRCGEGYDVPYQPFIEALGPLLDLEVGSRLNDLEPSLRVELTRLLPAVGEAASHPAVSVDPHIARYRLFEAVASWLAETARRAPVLLILEDVHWATEATLLMLRHLVRFPSSQLLVLVTYRSTEVGIPSPLADVLGQLHTEAHVRDIELRGLTQPEVAAIVHRSLPPGAVAASANEIHARTGGNALFVRELVASIAEEDRESAGRQPVWRDPRLSSRTQEVVLGRVRRLSADCRQLLESASVFDNEFGLGALLEMPSAGATPERLMSAIDEAVAARLVIEARPESTTYRFVHAVVRDGVVGSLGDLRRRQLHADAGRALKVADGAANLAQLSYHFTAAGPLGVEEAADYGGRAAEAAMSLGAFEEACDHYERALAARAGQDSDADLCDLVLDLATAQIRAGRVEDAAQTVERAAEMARALDLPAHLARAALAFEGEIVTGGQFWQDRMALLDEVDSRLPHDAEPIRARVVAMLAHTRAALAPGPEVEVLTTRALDLAQHSGDDVAMAAALQARRHALALPEYVHERLDLSARVVAHGESAGNPSWTMIGRQTRLADLLELGELADFDEELARYAADARSHRLPHDLWRAEVIRAMRALFRGELAEGERLSRRAFELGQRLEQPGALQSFLVQAFYLAWQNSTLGEVVPQAAAWAEDRPTVATWRAALALAYHADGRLDDARVILRDLAKDDFSCVARDNLWLVTLAVAAEVAWLVQDERSAASLHRLLTSCARSNVTIGTASALGAASRPAGLAAAAAGDLDNAVRLLDEAVRLNRLMGSPLWEAAAQRDLAAVRQGWGATSQKERST